MFGLLRGFTQGQFPLAGKVEGSLSLQEHYEKIFICHYDATYLNNKIYYL